MLFSVLALSCSTPQETAKREEQQGTLSIPDQFRGHWVKNNLYLDVTVNTITFNNNNGQVTTITEGTRGAQYYWEYNLFFPNNGGYVMHLFDTNNMWMNYSENGVWRGSIYYVRQ